MTDINREGVFLVIAFIIGAVLGIGSGFIAGRISSPDCPDVPSEPVVSTAQELVRVQADVDDLRDRVSDLETEVSVTDQSVEAAWETVNDLDHQVQNCCEEDWR